MENKLIYDDELFEYEVVTNPTTGDIEYVPTGKFLECPHCGNQEDITIDIEGNIICSTCQSMDKIEL